MKDRLGDRTRQPERDIEKYIKENSKVRQSLLKERNKEIIARQGDVCEKDDFCFVSLGEYFTVSQPALTVSRF